MISRLWSLTYIFISFSNENKWFIKLNKLAAMSFGSASTVSQCKSKKVLMIDVSCSTGSFVFLKSLLLSDYISSLSFPTSSFCFSKIPICFLLLYNSCLFWFNINCASSIWSFSCFYWFIISLSSGQFIKMFQWFLLLFYKWSASFCVFKSLFLVAFNKNSKL